MIPDRFLSTKTDKLTGSLAQRANSLQERNNNKCRRYPTQEVSGVLESYKRFITSCENMHAFFKWEVPSAISVWEICEYYHSYLAHICSAGPKCTRQSLTIQLLSICATLWCRTACVCPIWNLYENNACISPTENAVGVFQVKLAHRFLGFKMRPFYHCYLNHIYLTSRTVFIVSLHFFYSIRYDQSGLHSALWFPRVVDDYSTSN